MSGQRVVLHRPVALRCTLCWYTANLLRSEGGYAMKALYQQASSKPGAVQSALPTSRDHPGAWHLATSRSCAGQRGTAEHCSLFETACGCGQTCPDSADARRDARQLSPSRGVVSRAGGDAANHDPLGQGRAGPGRSARLAGWQARSGWRHQRCGGPLRSSGRRASPCEMPRQSCTGNTCSAFGLTC